MSKTIISIIIIIVIAALGYWIYQSMVTPEELTEKEQVQHAIRHWTGGPKNLDSLSSKKKKFKKFLKTMKSGLEHYEKT